MWAMLKAGSRAIPVNDVEMSEESLAENSDRLATTGIIFSHSDLRYHESGGHPSTAGQTTTSIPRPPYSWQLPLWIWLERYGATDYWPPVISARPRVSGFISRDAYSLAHSRAPCVEFTKHRRACDHLVTLARILSFPSLDKRRPANGWPERAVKRLGP